MPIEMPRGLPFSVDTWNPNSMLKRHHFLTHAHKDHCSGITTHFHSQFTLPSSPNPLFSAIFLKLIAIVSWLDESLFVGIEVGQSLTIDDPDGSFSVTAYDANHCPGAVMFLFEGEFGNILHTGDCRLTPECLQNLPEKYISRKGKQPSCQLDFVFLDCTFGKSLMKIPSKQSALQQVMNCIWKHPDTPRIYLTCNMLGQEEVLVQVFQTFGSKIYVDKVKHPDFRQILQFIAPQILSEDPSSRFHLFEGFPKLYEKAKTIILEARENMQPEPLIIRPSAQWYAHEETELTATERKILEKSNLPVKDQFGVWHVCYSMHSSKQELEWALELLSPKWVVSTTPECRAMELGYVKKHCFTPRDSNDRFWKVLDMSIETSLKDDVLVESSRCFSAELNMKTNTASEELEAELPKTSINQESVLVLPSRSKKPSITLFGRARLGYHSCILAEEMKTTYAEENNTPIFDSKIPISSLSPECPPNYEIEEQKPKCSDDKENVAEKANESNTKPIDTDTDTESNLLRRDATVCKSVSHSYTGSLKTYSDNFRKLYRSMNVPVPQPLPSLVKLMESRKRIKRQYEI
ncbi:5' exonuclease Apollo [Bienertia sinuspersici]